MNNKQEANKRGKIICTRVIGYNEVSQFLSNMPIEEAIEKVMRLEQTEWKKNNHNSDSNVSNTDFYKSCFPFWLFYLDEKKYSPSEARASKIIKNVAWDIELKVEHDSKLRAYILLNKEKENI